MVKVPDWFSLSHLLVVCVGRRQFASNVKMKSEICLQSTFFCEEVEGRAVTHMVGDVVCPRQPAAGVREAGPQSMVQSAADFPPAPSPRPPPKTLQLSWSGCSLVGGRKTKLKGKRRDRRVLERGLKGRLLKNLAKNRKPAGRWLHQRMPDKGPLTAHSMKIASVV